MKTILTVLAFALSFTINAQTVISSSISLTENSHFINNSSVQYLALHSNGCGGILTGDITIIGNLNLNNKILFLKQGTNLNVTGSINGDGEIRSCNSGNNSGISVCGNVQNNVTFNGINCSTLSSPIFDISKDFGHNYTVFDVLGKEIARGVSNIQMYAELPKNTFLIIKVEGFKEEKRRFISE